MANHFDRHYCGKCGLTYVYQKAEAWERFHVFIFLFFFFSTFEYFSLIN
jgi:hypothetical protein